MDPKVQALESAFKETAGRISSPPRPLVLLCSDDGLAVTAGYLMVAEYVGGFFNSYRMIWKVAPAGYCMAIGWPPYGYQMLTEW